jgi:hypothetical protein
VRKSRVELDQLCELTTPQQETAEYLPNRCRELFSDRRDHSCLAAVRQAVSSVSRQACRLSVIYAGFGVGGLRLFGIPLKVAILAGWIFTSPCLFARRFTDVGRRKFSTDDRH